MTNKRGQIPWKIVGIILAIAVLVLFIFGLATGTNPLFGAIGSFGGGSVTIGQDVQSCQQDCLTQNLVDYCGVAKEVVFQKGEEARRYTCYGLESAGVGLQRCTGINAGLCINTRSTRIGNRFVEGLPVSVNVAPNLKVLNDAVTQAQGRLTNARDGDDQVEIDRAQTDLANAQAALDAAQ